MATIRIKKSIHSIHAPECALPDCKTPVNYHSKYIKQDQTIGYNWKSFCEPHRTFKKAERDAFLNSRGGCENKDGRLGVPCPGHHPGSLTIDHIDGNRHNNDQDNLQVLCQNCHILKTKLYKDHLNTYDYVPAVFHDLFDVED